MMIKVYVSRFDKKVDSEPHMECYEIEKTPQMKEDYFGAFNPTEYAEGGGLSLSYGSMVNAAAGLGMAGINMGLNAVGNAQRRK